MQKLALVLVIGLSSVNAHAVDIQGLYNTGVGFAAGTQDTHYALSSTTGSVDAYGYVTTNGSFPLAGAWLNNTSTSYWLTPSATQGASFDPFTNGTYTWKTTFDLTGFDAATASLAGQFAADNSALAYLNGNLIGSSNGFASFSTFAATANDFVAGINTLSFVVTNLAQNGGNPTGLRVEFLSSNVAAVPEADTYALMLAALGLMGAIARRKNVA